MRPLDCNIERVDELNDSESLTWDLSAISAGLSETERKAILSIRLSRHITEDTWIWLPHKQGQISVKSAYGLVVFGLDFHSHEHEHVAPSKL